MARITPRRPVTTTTAAAKKSLAPTRKWLANEITAAGAVAVMLLTGDSTITDPEKVAAIGFVIQAVVTYLVPNDNTPGGVPVVRR